MFVPPSCECSNKASSPLHEWTCVCNCHLLYWRLLKLGRDKRRVRQMMAVVVTIVWARYLLGLLPLCPLRRMPAMPFFSIVFFPLSCIVLSFSLLEILSLSLSQLLFFNRHNSNRDSLCVFICFIIIYWYNKRQHALVRSERGRNKKAIVCTFWEICVYASIVNRAMLLMFR